MARGPWASGEEYTATVREPRPPPGPTDNESFPDPDPTAAELKAAADALLQVTVTLHDLVPGQVYYFRFRAHTRTGLGEYSPVASIRVL